MDEPVRVGVDVGGTFTDVVLVVDDDVTTAKVPTKEVESEGVVAGIRAACQTAGIDPSSVDSFRHGTTVAVNALLESTVAETALVTTEGFGDVLAIGRQTRPSLYDLDARRPTPLVPAERRYEVAERATTDGIELTVDPSVLRELAAAIDAEAVAISFLHAYAHPENERRAAAILREELDVPVVASHEVLPAFREYERTATTVADAALAPVVRKYLDELSDRVAERSEATDCESGSDRGERHANRVAEQSEAGLPQPRIMQANGGIADAAVVRERPISTVMSGPAAGVVGASAIVSRTAQADGSATASDGVVTLDMGGTSTDVALVRDGEIERTTAADVGGHPVRIPMVDVTTVGAGGGSIAHVDAGGALRVGPESAGAEPGPACYGRGGTEPTVTDAALQLGYLGPETTLGDDLTLSTDAAATALSSLADAADLDGPTAVAQGVLRVAIATTTRAIRRVTVERGHDPRSLTLSAFGGAGPMLAARLAERLDIGHVVVPPASGVLSALGLLAADESQDTLRTVRMPLADATAERVDEVYEELIDRTRRNLSTPSAAAVTRRADLRYAGQSHELTVDVDGVWDRRTVRERFHDVHEREHGFRLDDADVDLLALGVQATIPGDPPTISHEPTGDPVTGHRQIPDVGWGETTILDRRAMPTGQQFDGPAIVEGRESTTVCPPDWALSVDDQGALHCHRSPAQPGGAGR